MSVALAGFADRDFGTSSFFLFAAGILAAAVLGGLTQRSWRDFGTAGPAGGSTPVPGQAADREAPAG